MVKRFVSFLFLFVFLLNLFVCSVFGADIMQSDSDMFGFSYDDSPIYFCSQFLDGYNISVDSQTIDVSRLYFYIPVSQPCESLDFYLTIFKTGLPFSLNSSDYGSLSSGTYSLTASLDRPRYSTLGTSKIDGSSAYVCSYKFGFSDLPFSGFSDRRFIRLTFDLSGSQKIVLWLQKKLSQNLTGVLGNPTYTFSGTNDSHFVNYFSGSFQTDPVYIQGQLKSQYYDGSSVKVFSGSLLNSTSGSGGYLRIPKLIISAADPTANSMKFHALASAVTGSLTPSFSSQDTDLEGTYLDRCYLDTVTMSATRSYSDVDLIQAVNDASDRNHTDISNFSTRNHSDLQAISSQLGELVQHQNQVNQTGDDIGSTTSDSSISDTSGNLSSGSDGLSGVLSTASDISSVSGAAAPYISFIGAAMPIILNFGNGVLSWAVIGIIACSVFLWILKKVAE